MQILRSNSEPARWDTTPEYKRARRALERRRLPYCEHPACIAPDIPIDYDGPRYVVDENGRRRLNPWSFEADHVIARAEGGGHTNLRACHTRCNRLAGAKLGAKRRWGGVAPVSQQPIHTRQWW